MIYMLYTILFLVIGQSLANSSTEHKTSKVTSARSAKVDTNLFSLESFAGLKRNVGQPRQDIGHAHDELEAGDFEDNPASHVLFALLIGGYVLYYGTTIGLGGMLYFFAEALLASSMHGIAVVIADGIAEFGHTDDEHHERLLGIH